MDLLREKLRCLPMGAVLRKGGNTDDESQHTTNTDERAALDNSAQFKNSNGNSVFISSSDAGTAAANADAVKAMVAAGDDTIGKVGGAIVDLNRDTVAAQTKSFDSLVRAGAGLVDKLIDTNAATTSGVVAAFKPVEGANADVAKWGAIAAAAGAVALVLLKGR